MVSSLDQTDVGRALELIQVNVTCLTELTLLAAKEMVHRGHGGIINIGSVVSFQPVAYMGVYAASKAYVLHFSEALWAELQAHGVTLTTLCPGTTRMGRTKPRPGCDVGGPHRAPGVRRRSALRGLGLDQLSRDSRRAVGHAGHGGQSEHVHLPPRVIGAVQTSHAMRCWRPRASGFMLRE
jgi:NAD(P)-dependent dehydrogenase (short-subunit alcohol dehydrogenase family)